MSSSEIIRWGGIGFMLGGVVWIVFNQIALSLSLCFNCAGGKGCGRLSVSA